MKVLRTTGAALVVCLVTVVFILVGCGGSSSNSNTEFGRISGKVVSPSAVSEGKAGATVTVALEGTDILVEAEVGRSFIINDVPAGTYSVIARTSGWAKCASVRVEKGKNASTGEIQLEPVARISGRITDSASDEPIVDAIVTVEMATTAETAGLPAVWVTTTDADGNYAVGDLPAGSYCVDITKNSYKGLSRQFQSVTGEITYSESLALMYPLGQGKIVGTVYYKTSTGDLQPIKGVKVTLYQSSGTVTKVGSVNEPDSRVSNEWNHTRTRTDGTFELTGVPFSSFTLVTGPLGITSYTDSVNPTSSRALEYYYTFKPSDLRLAQ